MLRGERVGVDDGGLHREAVEFRDDFAVSRDSERVAIKDQLVIRADGIAVDDRDLEVASDRRDHVSARG